MPFDEAGDAVRRHPALALAGILTRLYPARSLAAVALLTATGMAEGASALGVLPLLSLLLGEPPPAIATSPPIVLLRSLGIGASLGSVLGFVVAMMFAKGTLQYLTLRQVGALAVDVTTDLRLRLVGALFRARWDYFTRRPVGELANSLGAEVHQVGVAVEMLGQVAAAATITAAYGILVLAIAPEALLLAAIGTGIHVMVLRRAWRVGRAAGVEQAVAQSALIRQLVDALNGFKPIRAMRRETALEEMLKAESQRLRRSGRRLLSVARMSQALNEPILTFIVAATFLVGTSYLGYDLPQLTLIAFSFWRIGIYIGLVQATYRTLSAVAPQFASLLRQIADAEREREEPEEPRPPSPAVAPSPTTAPVSLSIQDIEMAFGDFRVLDHASLEVPAGALAVVVGKSGAGKTTLLDLLCGLRAPTGGTIRVNGVALQNISMARWRRSLGYVPQETILLHATIRENVTLGTASITEDDIHAALEAAGAAAFVARLPLGIDTVVGEHGSRLSGGERQRIAVARALVHQPRLLLLDEATSGLDAQTEEELVTTIAAMRGAVTVVAVTHRPAFLDAADVAYRLEDGRATRIDLAARRPRGAAASLGSSAPPAGR